MGFRCDSFDENSTQRQPNRGRPLEVSFPLEKNQGSLSSATDARVIGASERGDAWVDSYLPRAFDPKNEANPCPTPTIRVDSTLAGGLAPKLGHCLEEHHPIYEGRVLVRCFSAEGETTRWTLCLMGVRPQNGDRLLLNYVRDLEQWVVSGIIDGFRERLSSARANPTLVLEPGQALTMVNLRGQALGQVSLLDDGVVVRSLGEEMALGTSGTLRLFGDEVKIESTLGNVEIASAEDAVIRGNFVRLN